MAEIDGHYTRVIAAIKENQLVPFLGANINLSGRLREQGKPQDWQSCNFPPSDQELAIFLDKRSNYSYSEGVRCPLCDADDIEHLPEGCPIRRKAFSKMPLQHVAQYTLQKEGEDFFYGEMKGLFGDKQYMPGRVHQFLAQLPKAMRAKGYSPPYPLLVTTCFDKTLEQSFADAGENYDLVTFIFDESGGAFSHQPPGGEPQRIDSPNDYSAFSLHKRPVILKLYGGIKEGEDFVITEDNFIDYLGHRDIAELIPASLLRVLRSRESYIWFLGYSPSYWNLRVILRRLWRQQISAGHGRGQTWWAIQAYPETIDETLWKTYGVGKPMVVPSLDDYIAELDEQVQEIAPRTQPSTVVPGGDESERNQVFISYSHKDKIWLEKLKLHLKPAIQEENIHLWDDTQIQAGSKWRDEIRKALKTAKVAVLLVSGDFIYSDFISQNELQPLLDAASEKRLKIVWFLVSSCIHEDTALAEFQAAHETSEPLDSLPDSQQNAVLVDVAKQIIAAAKDRQ